MNRCNEHTMFLYVYFYQVVTAVVLERALSIEACKDYKDQRQEKLKRCAG